MSWQARGDPKFDAWTWIKCPKCRGMYGVMIDENDKLTCDDCGYGKELKMAMTEGDIHTCFMGALELLDKQPGYGVPSLNIVVSTTLELITKLEEVKLAYSKILYARIEAEKHAG